MAVAAGGPGLLTVQEAPPPRRYHLCLAPQCPCRSSRPRLALMPVEREGSGTRLHAPLGRRESGGADALLGRGRPRGAWTLLGIGEVDGENRTLQFVKAVPPTCTQASRYSAFFPLTLYHDSGKAF